MLTRLLAAIDERTGLRLRPPRADAPLPGGVRADRTFGAVIAGLLLLELTTGLALSFFYAPTVTDAWASLVYLERTFAFGGFLRAVHHWGVSALVVAVALFLVQQALSGGYRRPRELSWWLGLLLVHVVIAFAITGIPLPWDQRGYWASQVEAGIVGAIPLLGPTLRRALQGGNEYGNLTLLRFYVLHALVLPLGALTLCALLVWQLRRPVDAPKRTGVASDQWLASALAFLFAVAVTLTLAWVAPQALHAPADPSSSYLARPAWFFLPLNQLVGLFPAERQFVGSVVLPGLAAVLLFALPLLDRGRRSRVLVLAGITASGVLVGALFVKGLLAESNDPRLAKANAHAERAAARAKQRAATVGIPPGGGAELVASDPLTLGEKVFARRCAGCHPIAGEGTDEMQGPDLGGYLSEAWLTALVNRPEDPRFFGNTAITGMEDYVDEDQALVAKTVALMRALRGHPGKGPDELPAELADGLAAWEELSCDNCHELIPGEEGAAPNLSGYGADEWLLAFLRTPDAPHFYADQNEMPSYEEKLSASEREAVVVFLRSLEALEVAREGSIPLLPKKADAPREVASEREEPVTSTQTEGTSKGRRSSAR